MGENKSKGDSTNKDSRLRVDIGDNINLLFYKITEAFYKKILHNIDVGDHKQADDWVDLLGKFNSNREEFRSGLQAFESVMKLRGNLK